LETTVSVGARLSVNVTPLLFTPPTFTTTAPVVVPVGAGTTMLVADQDVGVPVVPLNFTVLLPLVAPKFVPVIVTAVPTGPLFGDTLVMVGVAATVNGEPLLGFPPTVTTTLPVVAPDGTVAVMLVDDQAVVDAVVPLNATVLVPLVAPKFVPVIVTDAPTRPLVGESDVMVGGTVTVNAEPLLAIAPTVTTTLPVVAPDGTVAVMLVADQLVVDAVVPLNLTVLVPLVAPKFVPVMMTDAPTRPLVGESEVIVGVAGTVTVNADPLLAIPPTVTTTLPVVAPAGTVAVMLVADQAVVVAVVPLNVTVLVPLVAPKFEPAIVTDAPTTPVLGVTDVTTGAAAGMSKTTSVEFGLVKPTVL